MLHAENYQLCFKRLAVVLVEIDFTRFQKVGQLYFTNGVERNGTKRVHQGSMSYSSTLAWIRCTLSFSLLRSATMCIRGTIKVHLVSQHRYFPGSGPYCWPQGLLESLFHLSSTIAFQCWEWQARAAQWSKSRGTPEVAINH